MGIEYRLFCRIYMYVHVCTCMYVCYLETRTHSQTQRNLCAYFLFCNTLAKFAACWPACVKRLSPRPKGSASRPGCALVRLIQYNGTRGMATPWQMKCPAGAACVRHRYIRICRNVFSLPDLINKAGFGLICVRDFLHCMALQQLSQINHKKGQQ